MSASVAERLAALEALSFELRAGRLDPLEVAPAGAANAARAAREILDEAIEVAGGIVYRAGVLRNAALWTLAGEPEHLAAALPDDGDTLQNRAAVAEVIGRRACMHVGRVGTPANAARLRSELRRWAVKTHGVSNGAVWVYGTGERVALVR